jgi:hypothetical protein
MKQMSNKLGLSSAKLRLSWTPVAQMLKTGFKRHSCSVLLRLKKIKFI